MLARYYPLLQECSYVKKERDVKIFMDNKDI